MSLYSDLLRWREEQARREGVESFKVLSKAAIDGITATLPKDKESLTAIKGIKDTKYRKYGQAIIALVREYYPDSQAKEESDEEFPVTEAENISADTVSVSQFLDGLNIELSGMAARVRGEVSSVDVRERVVYFTLKDSIDESTLNCLIFRYAYQVSGVELRVGDEVVVEGVPEIYKPNGRMSLKVGIIELFGEGALKKAYDLLYQKLEAEGLFAEERKRPLPDFCHRIGLITSRDGAAIDDFRMNLGLQGIKVDFYPTAVEGKKAVFEILKALEYFNQDPDKYDALIIVRGGGSLESLQAFNNEALVREVAASKIPTLLGVGHEKDVTLAAQVADVMVSTPTATAKLLAEPWNEARQLVTHFEKHLPLLYQERLADTIRSIDQDTEMLLGHLRLIRERVGDCERVIAEQLAVLSEYARQKTQELGEAREKLRENFRFLLLRVTRALDVSEELLSRYDPKRALRLGYSLIKKGNHVLKEAAQAKIGDILDIQLGKGSLSAEVKKVSE